MEQKDSKFELYKNSPDATVRWDLHHVLYSLKKNTKKQKFEMLWRYCTERKKENGEK